MNAYVEGSSHTLPVWGRVDAAPQVDMGTLPASRVCVVGAGIAGLSLALNLLENGVSTTVLDRYHVGAGETARSSGHLASALDDRFSELQFRHDFHGAQLAAESHREAISLIQSWVERYRIECGFRRVDGYLSGSGSADPELLEKELLAARLSGLEVELVAAAPGLGALGPALRFPRQARIDPLAYLLGLARAVRERGGRIVENVDVTEVDDGSPCTVRLLDGRNQHYEAVAICTNVPFHRLVAYHTKQAAYRTFVVAARAPRAPLPDALFWDAASPYHYLRWKAGGGESDLLLIGGADHKTGQDTPAPFAELEAWARNLIPTLGAIEFAWSGQVIEPVDGLGFIGRDVGAENVYVATGDSGNGLTHATLAAPLLSALIGGHEHAWEHLYSPARKAFNRQWAGETVNMVKQYGDWIGAGDDVTPESLAPGQGAVVRDGLHRIALFRDERGELHRFSARCTHLGCVVHWNAQERSWDCPCHGSRFDGAEGNVLNGPATRGLHRIDPEAVASNATVESEIQAPPPLI